MESTSRDDVGLKTIEIQLVAVASATARSRTVFLGMTIVCLMILFGLWNSILSWDRGLTIDTKPLAEAKKSETSGQPPDEIATNVLAAENQKAVIGEYVKNRVISSGLLGIRISTNDLAVVGSAALLVVLVWFFFCQRRENRAIVSLLRSCDTKFEKDKEVCLLVYEGIVQNLVFTDLRGGDLPESGLERKRVGPRPNTPLRKIIKFLVFLPPATIGFIVVSDILSLFLDSFVRLNFNSPWESIGTKATIQILAFEVFAVFCLIYSFRICKKCLGFSEASRATLEAFEGKNIRDRRKSGDRRRRTGASRRAD